MKKFLSILLAAMMVLAMTTAFAAEDNTPKYTIKISNDNDEYVYTAYQIFKGDLAGDVLSNIEWGTGVTDEGKSEIGNAATKAESIVTVADAEAFATLVSKYLSTGTTSTFVEAVEADETAGTEAVPAHHKITGLPAGYYLVQNTTVPDGGAYTKYIMKVVNNVSATPKTDTTSHVKKVVEDDKVVTDAYKTELGSLTKLNDVADYCMGENVPFALVSKVPNLENFKSYKMIFHDEMSAGLSFNNDVKVYIAGTEVSSDKYSVAQNCEHKDAAGNTTSTCTFEVTITDLVAMNVAEGQEILVTFSAKLNSNAVVGLNGNPNKSQLEFSNNPNVESATTTDNWDEVVVFTYAIDVTKIDGAQKSKVENGETLYAYLNSENEEVWKKSTDDVTGLTPVHAKLSGAEFVLMNKAGAYAKLDSSNKVTEWVPSESDATVLTSNSEGLFKVIGLDDGDYKLKETKAPEGYNLLANPIEFKITATTVNNQNYAGNASEALTAIKITIDGTDGIGDVNEGKVAATVKNNVGATLPSTGGIGTTLFYLFGSIMAAGSALILVVRRRAEAEEE